MCVYEDSTTANKIYLWVLIKELELELESPTHILMISHRIFVAYHPVSVFIFMYIVV